MMDIYQEMKEENEKYNYHTIVVLEVQWRYFN